MCSSGLGDNHALDCELLGFNRVSSEQITEKASVLIL
jgi:hypothetical protein